MGFVILGILTGVVCPEDGFLVGHEEVKTCASFSADCSRIVSVNTDLTAKVWDATPVLPEILAWEPAPPPARPPITLASRLPVVLRGEDRPANFAERLGFAELAYPGRKFSAAARLWAEALELNPKLGEETTLAPRYNAACAAVLAAGGPGKDDFRPDEATKATLRRQALDWLTTELAAWGQTLASGTPQMRSSLVQALFHGKSLSCANL